jgi:radical SAM protein with 4Fe4S-binding SPASM domain
MSELLPTDIHAMNFKTAQIQTHSFCNADCIMCPYGDTRSMLKQGIMEDSTFTKVVDELMEYPSLERISLMLQNEPLLEKRILDHIRYIKDKDPDMNVGISTNGSRLTDRVLKELIKAGLSSLTFSINALTHETFAKIQRGLDFDIVMNNLRNLIDRNPRQLRITIKFMIIKENHFELAFAEKHSDLMGQIKNSGIPIDISPISNRAGSLRRYHDMLIHERLQSSKQKFYCHDVFENVNILFNGDVITCCADWLRKSVIGNLRHHTLREVWNSEGAQNRRINIKKGLYFEMDPCRNCSQALNIIENLKRRDTPRTLETHV